MSREESISEHTINQSKAHIPGLERKAGVAQVQREGAEAKGGNTEDEIDQVTQGPKDVPQPPSQAQARAPDCLDLLLGRVEQMHAMLNVHIDYSTRQFTYLQGKITTLSSQIQDFEKLDSESDAFQGLWPFRSKKGSRLA